METKILQRLKDIESKYDVKILLAVESGSRAWGFASKDSDYDVRFVYVHRKEWYLTLIEGRDVIEELDSDGVMDFAGWNLKNDYFRKVSAVNHYYHMAMNHDKRYLEKRGCEMKKFMYHIRGLLAAKYAAVYGTYPPVHFNDLVDKMICDKSIKEEIAELVRLKKKSREHNTMIVSDILVAFASGIAGEIEDMLGTFPEEAPFNYKALDAYFLNILNNTIF